VVVTYDDPIRIRQPPAERDGYNNGYIPNAEMKCVDVDRTSFKVAIGSNSSVIKVYDARCQFRHFERYIYIT